MSRSLLGAILLLAACRTTPFATVDPSTLPTAAAYPGAAVLVLLDEDVIRFEGSEPIAIETSRTRRLVLTERGRHAADFATTYSREFARVVSVDVRITTPDGEHRDYTLEDMRDFPAIEGTLYNDVRELTLDAPAVPVGSVVERVVVTERLRPTYFTDSFVFQDRHPVQRASFRFFEPEGWQLEHRAIRAWVPFEWAPRIEPASGGRWLIWEKDDIERLEAERHAPGLWDVAPVVMVRLAQWKDGDETKSEFSSFESYGAFVHRLQEGTAEPTPEIEAEVAAILADAPDDPRVRAARLYEWVQRNVRYVAVEIGLGGWRPYSAAQVFATRHGDCKDKATLLKAMLAVDGVKSHLASLFSHHGAPRRHVLPGLGNSNHAILAIDLPDGVVIADPTERIVPFGELPLRDQEAELLVARPEGGQLITTPGTTAKDNTLRVRLDLRLDATSSATGAVVLEAAGAFATALRAYVEDESADRVRGGVRGYTLLRDARMVEASVETKDVEGRIVTSGRGRVTIDEIGRKIGDARIVRLLAILKRPGLDLSAGDRSAPVVLDKREQRDVELTMTIPPSWSVSTLPEDVEIASPFGSYVQRWRSDGEKLVATARYTLDERIVPPEHYAAFDTFFDDITRAASRPVVIRSEDEKR